MCHCPGSALSPGTYPLPTRSADAPVLRKGVMTLECHASHCSGDGSAQLPGSTSAMRLPRRWALVPSEGSRMRPPWGAPTGRRRAGEGLEGRGKSGVVMGEGSDDKHVMGSRDLQQEPLSPTPSACPAWSSPWDPLGVPTPPSSSPSPPCRLRLPAPKACTSHPGTPWGCRHHLPHHPRRRRLRPASGRAIAAAAACAVRPAHA